uniref:Uncharacterized protein n=1 Tax=Arundo donax TaxID=35708 RepID=A0A0A9CRC9_ARUDO
MFEISIVKYQPLNNCAGSN